jgi:hypothetical protein
MNFLGISNIKCSSLFSSLLKATDIYIYIYIYIYSRILRKVRPNVECLCVSVFPSVGVLILIMKEARLAAC